MPFSISFSVPFLTCVPGLETYVLSKLTVGPFFGPFLMLLNHAPAAPRPGPVKLSGTARRRTDSVRKIMVGRAQTSLYIYVCSDRRRVAVLKISYS